jgi:hypothetical protein
MQFKNRVEMQANVIQEIAAINTNEWQRESAGHRRVEELRT